MDFALTPEHEMVRRTVREFAQGELAPLIKEADRRQEPPEEMLPRMAARYNDLDETQTIPQQTYEWLRSMGTFPVRRGTPDRRAIRHSLHVLEQGGVLLIFPEGTRSQDGRLKLPEPGAAMIALRTGVPVMPAAVINSHRIMRKGRRLPNPFGRVIVRYGRPMAVPKIEGRLDHATMLEWGNRIMAAIEALLPEDQHRAR